MIPSAVRFADVVSVVAVAILRGEILSVAPDGDEGGWGVIKCADALGAFDAKSRAWCGPDGEPSRFTREDAELRARRLTGSSFDGSAYEAVEFPARPTSATVGTIHSAVGTVRFACIDWTEGPGVEVEATHIVEHACEEPWGIDYQKTYEPDDSAFGAALAFVRLVGQREAYAALYAGEAA